MNAHFSLSIYFSLGATTSSDRSHFDIIMWGEGDLLSLPLFEWETNCVFHHGT